MSGRILPFEVSVHRRADTLLPWFVNGTLEGDELAFVETHLGQCERCRIEVDWLRDVQKACKAMQLDDGFVVPDTSVPVARKSWLQRATSSMAALPRWTQVALAAQLAAIAVLAAAMWMPDPGATYRTLGARRVAPSAIAMATAGDAHVVVLFDASITAARLAAIVGGAGARIVDGPTANGAYVLSLPGRDAPGALASLRGSAGVKLAEPLSWP